MPQFIFSYRSAKDYDGTADPDGLAAWSTFINGVIGVSGGVVILRGAVAEDELWHWPGPLCSRRRGRR